MEADRNAPHKLLEFAERVRHLDEENRHLREASRGFGQLAERVSASLHHELRKTTNNIRQWESAKNDRRYSTLRLPPDRSNDQD